MPAMKVLVCAGKSIPLPPIRMVLDSPATPSFPISILLSPVTSWPAAWPKAILPRPLVLVKSAVIAQTCVEVASVVALECLLTNSGVTEAVRRGIERKSSNGRVVKTTSTTSKRAIADGRVCAAAFVGAQSVPSDRRVSGSVDIVPERLVTNGRVPNPTGVAKERLVTNCCILSANAVASRAPRCRQPCWLRRWCCLKAGLGRFRLKLPSWMRSAFAPTPVLPARGVATKSENLLSTVCRVVRPRSAQIKSSNVFGRAVTIAAVLGRLSRFGD